MANIFEPKACLHLHLYLKHHADEATTKHPRHVACGDCGFEWHNKMEDPVQCPICGDFEERWLKHEIGEREIKDLVCTDCFGGIVDTHSIVFELGGIRDGIPR